MSIDDISISSNKQNMNASSASNTPNFTHTSGSTSQSMTPSDFGYQHLNRQSNIDSLESSPKSDVYESIEHAFKTYEPFGTAVNPALPSITGVKLKSPIKATINITYNLKSPRNTAEDNFPFRDCIKTSTASTEFSDYEAIDVDASDKTPKNILETDFDDTMVYEQVKFFKGAVSEVNHLLRKDAQTPTNDNGFVESDDLDDSLNVSSQIVPNVDQANKLNDPKKQKRDDEPKLLKTPIPDEKGESGDVLMPDQELNSQDSLEIDHSISMYENVKQTKPATVYENIDVGLNNNKNNNNSRPKADVPMEVSTNTTSGKENSKPGNFIVRQLANKFETSPVDAMPPFDFSKPFIRKACDNNRNTPCLVKARNNQQLNKTCKFTRSLDENAFVREFGNGKRPEDVNKSTHLISNVSNVLTENSPGRRVLSEQIRPKSLNPPKRLPHLVDEQKEICKADSPMQLELTNDDNIIVPTVEVKITPTNENPISLIQNNVNLEGVEKASDADRNSTPNIKVLGSFKLDRERIERIKEERRHQLNEKFRSESFKCEKDCNKAKSKSKIELNDLKDSEKRISDTLQFKSKSRNDIYNKRDADNSIALSQSLSSSGILPRTRRISDEKNQNDCVDMLSATDIKIPEIYEESKVSLKTRKIDQRSMDTTRDRDSFLVTNISQKATQ